MKDGVFIFLILVTLGSAVFTCFSKNIVYSAFSLLLTLGGIAGFYLMLGADFLAGIQLLLYVGGILVLIIFAVMLTHGVEQGKNTNPSRNPIIALIIGGAFLAVWLHGIWNTKWLSSTMNYEATTAILGNALLKKYLLPFELISVLLLVGLVGTVAVARLAHVGGKLNKDKEEN